MEPAPRATDRDQPSLASPLPSEGSSPVDASRSSSQVAQPDDGARRSTEAGQRIEPPWHAAGAGQPLEAARHPAPAGSDEPARHPAEQVHLAGSTRDAVEAGQEIEAARQSGDREGPLAAARDPSEPNRLMDSARHTGQAGQPLEAAVRSKALHQRIDTVRRFNRLYTRRIGVLPQGYLRSPFSLAEVRVLYELAHRRRTTATELARELDLDAGYLSRILAAFTRQGMLERTRSLRDGREQVLSLTQHGQHTFAPLEAAAREQIGALLERLSERQQERLVAAMHTVGALLGESASDAQPDGPGYRLRQPRPGDMGWVVARHGAIYADEYGWDPHFEALVASIVAKFVDHFDPERERCWIAERDGEPVGCIFLVKATRTIGKLRLFLVEPDARGLGIGKRLVDECIRFARDAGYRKMRLWTQSNLLASRHIYARSGFRLIDSEPHHRFGYDLVSETWELRL
jgi:DNA-binding MarR family transcriptional regulator/N-acetylglutamate synthase-like GNAT family acetyltransferase